ncbi:cupin [Variovorax sp. J22R133]|uniref:cupin n=1 Tax=Variovorax brevis TaxID=3053503 RepID=UPI002575E19D|nr:cupin [Variovorax sp. J22R133]MDM0111878.1 cupin [Variovorax sp. J22R133]
MKSETEHLSRPHQVLPANPASFSTRRISKLKHDFNEHPLFQLPALESLAKSLMPTGQCRFLRPGTTQGSAFSHDPTHPKGLSIEETFRRMEEPGSWLALYNVQTDPTYKALLGSIVDGLRPLIEREQPGIFLVTGFIFISAPPSVTPFHIDRENNFWLQLHGRKTMNVWENTDRTVVPARAVEDFIAGGGQEGVSFKEEFRARGQQFDVQPGDGVYWPSTSPHMTETNTGWVKPGDGISVSLGVNFYTEVTRRTARVHQFNRVLRRLGVSPSYPGESTARDTIKSPIGHLLAASRYRRIGATPPPGAY